MKALLLALFISSHAFSAIPHNGDDERSIKNPLAIGKQSREIRSITRKMNLVLLNSVKLKQLDNGLEREINDLAQEVQFLNDSNYQYDQEYLKLLNEEVEIYKEEIEFLTR